MDADVFVFTSRADTFGLVVLEAMACGTPVAALPVAPRDIVQEGVNGTLDENLSRTVGRARKVPRASCRTFALANDWQVVAQQLDVLWATANGTRTRKQVRWHGWSTR